MDPGAAASSRSSATWKASPTASPYASAAASAAIRKTAVDLRLAQDFHARVRLTGPVAMADEEFGTIKEGALVNSVLEQYRALGA